MNLKDRRLMAQQLTSHMMHEHYCKNNAEPIIALMDDLFSWFGAGEQEYAVGKEVVTEILRKFDGLVPRCNISDEIYNVLEITPDIFLCTGRMWITTDPSVQIYLQVHQRVTAVFRWTGEEMRCCHIHISNPYMEMTEDDVGFPTQMGRQSYEYMQACIVEQKKQIEMQTAMLERLSFEDSLTGLFNRNKFNQKIEYYQSTSQDRLGIACFDINGLKPINDQLGHPAGDQILCRTAYHIKQAFDKKAYRIGGDEFVVIDEESEEWDFYKAITSVRKRISEDQISVSIGLSWRSSQCSIREQFEEADHLMYKEKAMFYSNQVHDRRKR